MSQYFIRSRNAFVFVCFLVGVLYAIEPISNPNLNKVCDWPDAPHYKGTTTWGMGGGMVQGMGIQVRKWFDTNGFQLSLMPIVRISDEEKDVDVDAGASYLHALWEGTMYEFLWWPARNMVYSYAGGRINYRYYKGEFYGYDMMYYSSHYEERTYVLGGGLGLQMNIRAVQIHLGLGALGSLEDNRDYDNSYNMGSYNEKELVYSLTPSIEMGLGYTFGWK